MPTPIPQQDTGHLDQPQVVGGLLLVAHQDRPALRQPAQRALHHPPPRRIAFLARDIEFLLTDASDVGDVVAFLRDLPGRVFVVAFVQAQMLIGRLFSGFPTLDDDGIEGGLEKLEVGHVRSGHHHRQRSPVGLDQEGALYPVFAPVGGV